MTQQSIPLSTIFNGWDGYQTSILHAVEPLTGEQLAWRPPAGSGSETAQLRSVGELAAHMALGRVWWFSRMPAPGSLELEQKITAMGGQTAAEAAVAKDHAAMIEWLEAGWKMIADTLQQWTVADLSRTYRHTYWGKTYAVSYQWTIWRIMTHDIHHGGELALMLGQQGIQLPELGDLFGHLTEPPLAD